MNGADRLCEQLERRFGPEGAGGGSNGSGLTWQRSPCLGQCDRGSAAMIQHAGAAPARVVLAPADLDQIRAAISPSGEFTQASQDQVAQAPLIPQATGDRSALRLLRRVCQVDPGSLDSYRAAVGYEMLRRSVSAGGSAAKTKGGSDDGGQAWRRSGRPRPLSVTQGT